MFIDNQKHNIVVINLAVFLLLINLQEGILAGRQRFSEINSGIFFQETL